MLGVAEIDGDTLILGVLLGVSDILGSGGGTFNPGLIGPISSTGFCIE
jgi:hypothetical protein